MPKTLANRNDRWRCLPPSGDEEYLDYAIRHRDVIAAYGRFPHRNAMLGRESTAGERDYLSKPGAGF